MATNKVRRIALLESAELSHHSLLNRLLRRQFSGSTSEPENIQSQLAEDARAFQISDEGNGIFGKWVIDLDGLPAYEYTFDQHSDPRAGYPTTDGVNHRDHWHQVGNQRITALASNDGIIQVYIGDRGGMFLNRFEAWDSEGTVSPVLAFFAQIALLIVRFMAWLSRPKPSSSPQPFVATSAVAENISYNPRNTPSKELLQKIGELNAQTSTNMAFAATMAVDKMNKLSGSPDTPHTQIVQTQVSAPANPHAYAGGFSYIDDGTEIWATAYRYRPANVKPRRIFGMGYFETQMEYRNLRITRRVSAPMGNDPVLTIDIHIENLGIADTTINHYEYWDVNVQQLQIEWLRTAGLGAASDCERRVLNSKFTLAIQYDATQNMLLFQQTPPKDSPPIDVPSPINWYPPAIFLANLGAQPDLYFCNRMAFFGSGNARRPEALVTRRSSDLPLSSNAGAMPYCMVMKHNLSIPAQQTKHLRFVYGAADSGAITEILSHFQTDNNTTSTMSSAGWKNQLAYFSTGQDSTLQREMAWHAYNLLSSTVYNNFHNVHVIPQGSAYLYLHGADGAPRDQALFTIPTTYLNPLLARDMLRLIMRLTDGQTGQIPYSFAGHGYISNALNVHTQPSDLDLFFLLAMSEYLSATGDMDFLDEHVPFYPPGTASVATDDTVLDHIRLALSHLFNGIGIGQIGLFRIGSGDWSDSIVLQAATSNGLLGLQAYQNSKSYGESIPNSQMALYILPIIANILRNRAPDIAKLVQDGRLDKLRRAVESQWNQLLGGYNRAILRDGNNQLTTVARLDLEAQVWGLICGSAHDAGNESNLIENVESKLDRPSPIGALLMPGQPYKMVWPAISQLLTWGYARSGRGELAWRSLTRNTFAAHAHEYPAIWYGLWSGPDGINGLDAEHPEGAGLTWNSPLTPMTDFPVMNANPDAMALLGLLRVCGIEPAQSGDGLVIRPVVPRNHFTLDLPLMRLDVEQGKIRGEYRAQTSGEITLYLYPQGAESPSIVHLKFRQGDRVPFESV